ncbi:TonB-dependent siderophore receptor [Pasteurellaceae bacterium USgator11]|nr:TonB-dependent siderophore receptor [Pasteurellaceae bacterium UScroc12]TNG94972.1 TonB-dependent siderophore receptor [Pasteurellaceae bacterium USgator41]TNH00653.1 TonB-dependent siderophore receptor [Pasteurellaceae bacterium UScroc31]TNH02101.1 TonB-dependent siderophore receptor [Pasteurellaceae bacterium USgator11]
MKNKTFHYSALTTALLLSLNPALAETQAGEMLEEINVVGSMNKLDVQPFNQAKSATVLDNQTLTAQGIEKADEIARYQAGFTSQVFGSDTNTNWFRVRGSEASQAIDGMPALSQGFFTPQVDMYGVEGVEVIKGSDSMAFGASNAGGLINYITKRPNKENIGKGEITTHFGNKNQRGIGADYTGSLNSDDSLRYRLVSRYSHADGEWNGTWSENYYIAPSLAWDISDKTNLTILASYLKTVGVPSSNFLPQDGTLIPTAKGRISSHANLGDPTQDYEKSISKSVGYEFNHDFGNGLSFSQNYRYQIIDNRHRGAYAYPSGYDANWNPIPLAQSNYEVARAVVYNNGTAKSHSVDNRVSWKYSNEVINNTLVAGMDYRNQKFDSLYTLFGTQGMVNVYDPAASYGTAATINAPRVLIKSRQSGFYLQDNAILWDTIGLSAGVRHDRVRNSELASEQNVRKNHTSYSGSVMYFNDLGLNPYYAYTESFRVPTGLSGNATLYKPNITKQHEVGIKYMPEWVDGTISVALFQAKDKGALVNQGTGATVSSADPIKRKGVEVQANLNVTEKLQTLLAYTYVRSVTENANGSKTNTALIPKHTLSTRVAYQFSDKLNAGVGIRYVGKSVTASGSLYSGYQVPSSTVVDLFARYQISENLAAQVNIDNLGNRKYLAGCDYYCYYAEGISAVGNLSYKF